MKHFKYWVFQRTDPTNESNCCFVRAVDQDAATSLTEPPVGPYPASTWLRVREIAEDELPEGAVWIQ